MSDFNFNLIVYFIFQFPTHTIQQIKQNEIYIHVDNSNTSRCIFIYVVLCSIEEDINVFEKIPSVY